MECVARILWKIEKNWIPVNQECNSTINQVDAIRQEAQMALEDTIIVICGILAQYATIAVTCAANAAFPSKENVEIYYTFQ